eukprot:1503031-Lingulodinium_polyedra.AAC.1
MRNAPRPRPRFNTIGLGLRGRQEPALAAPGNCAATGATDRALCRHGLRGASANPATGATPATELPGWGR